MVPASGPGPAFLSRYLLRFYQTSIGDATGFFGMNTTATGIAFALVGVAAVGDPPSGTQHPSVLEHPSEGGND